MKDVNDVATELRALLKEGGPYQAQKAFQAYSEVQSKFSKLSESDQMIEVQKMSALYHDTQFALNLGVMIGDMIISPEAKKLNMAIQQTHFSSREMEISGASLAGRLGDMSRERVRKGLPPLELLPRPYFIGTEPPFGSNVVWERF